MDGGGGSGCALPPPPPDPVSGPASRRGRRPCPRRARRRLGAGRRRPGDTGEAWLPGHMSCGHPAVAASAHTKVHTSTWKSPRRGISSWQPLHRWPPLAPAPHAPPRASAGRGVRTCTPPAQCGQCGVSFLRHTPRFISASGGTAAATATIHTALHPRRPHDRSSTTAFQHQHNSWSPPGPVPTEYQTPEQHRHPPRGGNPSQAG